jgi:hypothetical protein
MRLLFPFRTFNRFASNTRLQVFQNATQIVDPLKIRNVGIIAHIDAGRVLISIEENENDFFI